MQPIYFHSSEHIQVFTTVLAPRATHRYRAEPEKASDNVPHRGLRRSLSAGGSAWDAALHAHGSGHVLQALNRGTRGEGGGVDRGTAASVGPFLVQRPWIPQPEASRPQANSSPGLLHRILSKCRKRSECHGVTNWAFEGD